MIDSKRLTILKALSAWLEGITVANGYQHDLTGAVYRGRVTFGDEASVPLVNILEPLNPDRDPVVTDGGALQKERWVLLLQGLVDDDIDNPTDPAHHLMADVKKRLAVLLDENYPNTNPDYMLGGKIDDLWIEPGTVRPPDEVTPKAHFYLRIAVGLHENMHDPYAL